MACYSIPCVSNIFLERGGGGEVYLGLEVLLFSRVSLNQNVTFIKVSSRRFLNLSKKYFANMNS